MKFGLKRCVLESDLVTLTPSFKVRILVPLPNKKRQVSYLSFLFRKSNKRIRTLNYNQLNPLTEQSQARTKVLTKSDSYIT